MTASAAPVTIEVSEGVRISGLWLRAEAALAGFLFAHGAGAGMHHRFMEAVAQELAERGIATLRYQFPYLERGGRRPDAPAVCHGAVRAAAAAALRLAPDLPWIAGGKSFGGRMTSQAQAAAPIPGVRGLAFLGFPLHPPGRPSEERARHLDAVEVPMLFLQGTRDEFAARPLIERVVGRLAPRAALELYEGADHSFHVQVRSGRTDAEVRGELADRFRAWVRSTA